MVEPLMDKCPTEPVTLPHPVLRFVGQHKIQPLRWRHALEIQPSLADSDVRLGNRPRVAHNQPVLRFSHQLSDCINQHVNRLLVTMTCRHVPIARYARLKYRWIPEGVHLISVNYGADIPARLQRSQRVQSSGLCPSAPLVVSSPSRQRLEGGSRSGAGSRHLCRFVCQPSLLSASLVPLFLSSVSSSPVGRCRLLQDLPQTPPRRRRCQEFVRAWIVFAIAGARATGGFSSSWASCGVVQLSCRS
jgi:hypothetical protein